MDLFLENGKKAGLYDVCEWWMEKYPSDIFVGEPSEVVAARACMWQILEKRKV